MIGITVIVHSASQNFYVLIDPKHFTPLAPNEFLEKILPLSATNRDMLRLWKPGHWWFDVSLLEQFNVFDDRESPKELKGKSNFYFWYKAVSLAQAIEYSYETLNISEKSEKLVSWNEFATTSTWQFQPFESNLKYVCNFM